MTLPKLPSSVMLELSSVRLIDCQNNQLRSRRHHRRLRIPIRRQATSVSPLPTLYHQLIGRIIICLCYTACWIPLWILPDSFGGLAAGGFFIQSGVQGAWGVVPIYLGEISPPAFRASFGGLAYQLGMAEFHLESHPKSSSIPSSYL